MDRVSVCSLEPSDFDFYKSQSLVFVLAPAGLTYDIICVVLSIRLKLSVGHGLFSKLSCGTPVTIYCWVLCAVRIG